MQLTRILIERRQIIFGASTRGVATGNWFIRVLRKPELNVLLGVVVDPIVRLLPHGLVIFEGRVLRLVVDVVGQTLNFLQTRHLKFLRNGLLLNQFFGRHLLDLLHLGELNSLLKFVIFLLRGPFIYLGKAKHLKILPRLQQVFVLLLEHLRYELHVKLEAVRQIQYLIPLILFRTHNCLLFRALFLVLLVAFLISFVFSR